MHCLLSLLHQLQLSRLPQLWNRFLSDICRHMRTQLRGSLLHLLYHRAYLLHQLSHRVHAQQRDQHLHSAVGLPQRSLLCLPTWVRSVQ